MFVKGFEICEEYAKLPKNELMEKCFEIAEETELFISPTKYLKELRSKNTIKLAIELKTLENRRELMQRMKER